MYYVKVLIFYNRNALKMKKEGIVRGQELMKTLLIELVNYNVLCKSINILQQKCMKKEGIVRGQELMKTLLIELVNYNVLCKSINILQQKCVENEEGRYCQRSGINENITNRIGQL